MSGFFLHAWSIEIPGEIEVLAPLPPERVAVLDGLGVPAVTGIR